MVRLIICVSVGKVYHIKRNVMLPHVPCEPTKKPIAKQNLFRNGRSTFEIRVTVCAKIKIELFWSMDKKLKRTSSACCFASFSFSRSGGWFIFPGFPEGTLSSALINSSGVTNRTGTLVLQVGQHTEGAGVWRRCFAGSRLYLIQNQDFGRRKIWSENENFDAQM